MAVVGKKLFNFFHRGVESRIQDRQVRPYFADWRMLRDYNKRMDVKKYGKERIRLNALRKNEILPPELKAIANEEIAALPKTSNRTQLVARCVVTSRSRSAVRPYRVSRIIFRHLADYNLLAGWERARW